MPGLTKMKVALVDPAGFTPPHDHCLADALGRQGCKVVLVTTRLPAGPWNSAKTYERWEHFYRVANRLKWKRLRTYAKGIEHPLDMARLLRCLRRWKPDVIHFQWLALAPVDQLFLRRLRKIAPLVLTVHDTEPFQGAPSSRLQVFGLQRAYKHFDRYIVHTQMSRQQLMRHIGVEESKVEVIPPGVYNYYQEYPSISTRPDQDIRHLQTPLRVLFFGVLKPYKGVDVLLEAFAKLPKRLLERSELQIVGLPRIPVELLQLLARQLGVEDRVSWDLRFVDEPEVASYFEQADVVVLPYRRIDQSGVLMVALAFGKPVVASRVGGFAEVLSDGVHGFLVEPGDPNALASALATVLGDDVLRNRMARAVQALSSGELSWKSIARRTMELYQEVLSDAPRVCG